VSGKPSISRRLITSWKGHPFKDDKGYIIAGYHWINRIGYFITAEPWTDEWESIPLDEEAN